MESNEMAQVVSARCVIIYYLILLSKVWSYLLINGAQSAVLCVCIIATFYQFLLMGFLPDTQICGLRKCQEFRERFPRLRGLAILTRKKRRENEPAPVNN